LDDEGNPRVAIKELRWSGQNFAAVAEGEATVLEMMREVKDQIHLIKAIAYYQKGDNHYFMFPWAELGNLWEFMLEHHPDKTDPGYIIWFFTQLYGLAGALQGLHYMATNQGSSRNCRHGDLKPTNILCFKTRDSPKDRPRLVITDVGLAKVHNEATSERNRTTSNSAGTVTHAAPELEISSKAPRSRRFDVWSMGCILLECVIWLLYGPDKLKEFSKCLNGSFYILETQKDGSKAASEQFLSSVKASTEKKMAHIHPEVKNWISYIKDDWRYSEGTAVQLLVKLIEERLLKVELGIGSTANSKENAFLSTEERTPASQTSIEGGILSNEPAQISETETSTSTKTPASQTSIEGGTLSSKPAQISEVVPPTVIINEPPADQSDTASNTTTQDQQRASLSKRVFTVEYVSDPNSRAYAPEMKNELERILAGLTTKTLEAFGSPPSDNEAIPPGPSCAQLPEQDEHRGITSTRVR
jgi:serine/threonine protein kinase